VSVESDAGRGSCFTVRLPLEVAALEESMPDVAASTAESQWQPF